MERKRKAYRFTLDPNLHKDLIDFMESVPKVLRGGYCIEALKLLKEKMTMNPTESKFPKSNDIDFRTILK